MVIQFNTLQYFESLKQAGIPEAQAKVKTEALASALSESAPGLRATKDDLTGIKIEMADIKSELKAMKWMVVTIVAGVISLVAKVFF